MRFYKSLNPRSRSACANSGRAASPPRDSSGRLLIRRLAQTTADDQEAFFSTKRGKVPGELIGLDTHGIACIAVSARSRRRRVGRYVHIPPVSFCERSRRQRFEVEKARIGKGLAAKRWRLQLSKCFRQQAVSTWQGLETAKVRGRKGLKWQRLESAKV